MYICCCRLTVHSERFQAAALCEAPHTLDRCLSAEVCRGVSAAPEGAWTLVQAHEWKHLPLGCRPARPLGPPGHSGLPVAAGSSCTRPKAAGHRGAVGDSLWGGVGVAQPFSPSGPGVRREYNPQDKGKFQASAWAEQKTLDKMYICIYDNMQFHTVKK